MVSATGLKGKATVIWGSLPGDSIGAPCPFYETNLEIFAPARVCCALGVFCPFPMPKSDSGPMTLVGKITNDQQREASGSCLISVAR